MVLGSIYNPAHERKVDISTQRVKLQIEKAQQMYHTFSIEFKELRLEDNILIDKAYSLAQSNGILKKAAEMRELIFGKDMTTYGVSYISDSCVSGCTYCPIRRDSIDVETGKPIPRRKLSLEEFITDTMEIIKDGHSHICFLAGDGDLTTKNPEKLIPYLQALDGINEFDEIILNVTPQTTHIFRLWRDAVKNKSMQFRVFQETYNENIYAKKHPFGPKANYMFRKDSQSRALDAGFDNYGCGILLGLNSYFIQEIDSLVTHVNDLTSQYGQFPARICLPTANSLAGVNNVEQQIKVSSQVNELAYALVRLAMPEVSIVSSERDTPEMLQILDRYATNRTVSVKPSVGGNLQQALQKESLLKQTTVHSSNPKTTQDDYIQRGYNLLFQY